MSGQGVSRRQFLPDQWYVIGRDPVWRLAHRLRRSRLAKPAALHRQAK